MTQDHLAASAPERIARVESGLLPETELLSDTPSSATLAERMAYHRVPGLSLAVIADHRLAWARGYGVREQTSAIPAPARRASKRHRSASRLPLPLRCGWSLMVGWSLMPMSTAT
jgi:hypothetical protein